MQLCKMIRPSTVVTLALSSFVPGVPALSQPCPLPVKGSSPSVTSEMLETLTTYADIVGMYREGHSSRAGQRLGRIRPKRLSGVFDLLEGNGWTEPCLLAAALLHTELGMQSTRELDDGRGRAQFDSAWNLTEIVRAEETRLSFQRNWLLLTSLFYQRLLFDPEVLHRASTEVLSLASVLFERAESQFDRAVEAFPGDPEILLAAGTLFEWSGTPRLGKPSHLERAEELYERSCRAAPNDPVAHLRLATVLIKRARFAEAGAPLRRVMELPSDDETAFRAHMALGRLAEREDRHAEAIEHYRAATTLNPDWQVGYVALSHALHATGDRAESRRELLRGLQLPWTDDNLFGWWSYEAGLVERFGMLLERMRERVSL